MPRGCLTSPRHPKPVNFRFSVLSLEREIVMTDQTESLPPSDHNELTFENLSKMASVEYDAYKKGITKPTERLYRALEAAYRLEVLGQSKPEEYSQFIKAEFERRKLGKVTRSTEKAPFMRAIRLVMGNDADLSPDRTRYSTALSELHNTLGIKGLESGAIFNAISTQEGKVDGWVKAAKASKDGVSAERRGKNQTKEDLGKEIVSASQPKGTISGFTDSGEEGFRLVLCNLLPNGELQVFGHETSSGVSSVLRKVYDLQNPNTTVPVSKSQSDAAQVRKNQTARLISSLKIYRDFGNRGISFLIINPSAEGVSPCRLFFSIDSIDDVMFSQAYIDILVPTIKFQNQTIPMMILRDDASGFSSLIKSGFKLQIPYEPNHNFEKPHQFDNLIFRKKVPSLKGATLKGNLPTRKEPKSPVEVGLADMKFLNLRTNSIFVVRGTELILVNADSEQKVGDLASETPNAIRLPALLFSLIHNAIAGRGKPNTVKVVVSEAGVDIYSATGDARAFIAAIDTDGKVATSEWDSLSWEDIASSISQMS